MITYVCESCKKQCGSPVNGMSGREAVLFRAENNMVVHIQVLWEMEGLSFQEFEAKQGSGPHICKKCFQKLVTKAIGSWKTIQMLKLGTNMQNEK